MGNQIDDKECFNKKMCVKSIHSKVLYRRRPKKEFPICANNIENFAKNNIITNNMNNTIPPYTRQNMISSNNDIPAIIVINNRADQNGNQINNRFPQTRYPITQNIANELVTTNRTNLGIATIIPTIQNNGCTQCGQYNTI